MTKKGRNTLEQEISYVAPGLFILPGAALTGILTHVIAGQASWQQWLYIAHSLLGIALTVILPFYTFFHIKRTLGVRRVGTIISGWFTFLIMAALAGTGVFIVTFGQTETTRWIFHWHIYIAYACLALIVMHIVAHRYMYNKQAGTANFRRHPSLLPKNLKQAGLSLGLLAVILLAMIFGEKAVTTYLDRPVEVADYDYPFGQNPFFPSETTTVNNQFVRKEQIAGSPQCGSCHEQIFKEWRASIHSQTASDPAYATNINLTVEARGMAAVRNCEGCHSAVALLTGQIKAGGQHSAVPNTIAHSEGIGCFTCHGISRVVHPKGNGSYEFDPKRGYLFAYSNNFIGRKLHNFLTRVHPEEHRKIMFRPVLASPQICAACHVQFMDTVLNDVGWIKMQDEYSAWLKSSYSGQTDQRFAHQSTLRCQDCHMSPVANSGDPSANEHGMARSHRWLGANTAIPTVTGDHEQVRLTREFLQADRVRIHIERPWRKDAPQSALYVSEAIRAKSETPFFFYLGERASFDITITNHLVGHDFPGGTIDINQAWVSFRVVDATDNLIFESGDVDNEGNVDPDANFYYAIPVDKTGKQVWKHDLFRMTGESYRNVIPAGQTDMLNYQFDIPYWAKTPLTVSATVRYRKFNNRYAQFALGELYQTLPVVDMAEDILTVPLLTKPPGIEN